uniref:Uncharacterized protein n=1 Tax=Heterorhabditis bacteriophora TaxID=37862 RepID=A0A1I7WUK1_HETBA
MIDNISRSELRLARDPLTRYHAHPLNQHLNTNSLSYNLNISSTLSFTTYIINTMIECLKLEELRFVRDPLTRSLWQYLFPIQFSLGVLGNGLNLWVLASDEVSNVASDLSQHFSLNYQSA